MMKHSKTGIPSIRTSTLMLAISMAMVGCGGGSSSSGGTRLKRWRYFTSACHVF
jgi:hypothetical protein